MEELTPLLQLVDSVGQYLVFLWLFVRQLDRTQKVSEEHKSDLRKLARLPLEVQEDNR